MPVGAVNANNIPVRRRVWVSGVMLSFIMTGLVLLAFPIVRPAPGATFVVPPLLAALTAFAFAAMWPRKPWYWGVILASGFCAYFLIVFVAYLSIGQWNGTSLARALTVLLAGIGGAAAAAWIRPVRDLNRVPGCRHADRP